MEKRRVYLVWLVLLVLGTGGCGKSEPSSTGGSGKEAGPTTLRLGYFPNLTHAPALAGVERGFFTRRLGPDTEVEFQTFNAGPSAVEALFSKGLDATYIGPGPAINAFAKSNGEAVRLVSGATEGGAFFVVHPSITGAQDLKGKKVASPQLGNTQDIALRNWLKSEGLKTDIQGGGDVSIVPQENAQTLDTFKAGRVAGAWLPEPWASRLVAEAGAKVLVDERDLWPDGRFPTTVLLVRTEFLEKYPATVRKLIEANQESIKFLTSDPAPAQQVVNKVIAQATGKAIPDKIIASAWESLNFKTDVVPKAFTELASGLTGLGLLGKTDVRGMIDLNLLEQINGA